MTLITLELCGAVEEQVMVETSDLKLFKAISTPAKDPIKIELESAARAAAFHNALKWAKREDSLQKLLQTREHFEQIAMVAAEYDMPMLKDELTTWYRANMSYAKQLDVLLASEVVDATCLRCSKAWNLYEDLPTAHQSKCSGYPCKITIRKNTEAASTLLAQMSSLDMEPSDDYMLAAKCGITDICNAIRPLLSLLLEQADKEERRLFVERLFAVDKDDAFHWLIKWL